MADRPAALLLAPVGAGKTEAAIQHLLTLTAQQPFARAWVLLASERQIYSFRQRMVAAGGGRRVFFNAEFFNFYALYEHLLDAAGAPQRCLDTAARYSLLRRLLATLHQEAPFAVFDRIATLPGFARLAADFIFELKQNLIGADDFEAAAQTDKDRDLARLYRAYQAYLKQHNLVDREGEGWLALDELRALPSLATDVDLLIVDGYDQFTPLQARLLALLAGRARETFITLTTVPEREQTIGRRFERARVRLVDAFADAGVGLTAAPTTNDDDRHPALTRLLSQIFRRDSQPTPASEAVQFVEAPDITTEVAAILRRVKRLLLAGIAPDDMVIALRSWGQYAPSVAAVAAEFDLLPHLALQYSEPLGENPAVRALFDLLDLADGDFRRRALLDVLASPYLSVPGLTAAEADSLERVSQTLRISGGRGAWLDALDAAPRTRHDPEDDESPFLLGEDEATVLKTRLAEFFAQVTPPPTGTNSDYIGWLENLIGDDPAHDPEDDPAEGEPPPSYSLHMIARIKAGQSMTAGRDLAALDKFKGLLRGLLSTEQLYTALDGALETDWQTWLTDLKNAVTGAVVERQPSRGGRVLVTTATDARGLPHTHVFIAGLAEGVFPARRGEDLLYLDSERRAFAGRGIPLQTSAERADDDGLFYELISLARGSLTLSRPYIQQGEPWAASHLWRGALAVFDTPPLERLPIGGVTAPEDAATLSEAALSLADYLNRAGITQVAAGLHRWLGETYPAYWTHIAHGRRIELARLSASGHRYAGVITQSALIEQIARKLGDGRTWSASQLNEYGLCGFRFFAGRLLDLEALEEPEDGMDVLQRGTLYHEILEETYRAVAAKPLIIALENTDAALSILAEVAGDRLASAPQRLGFRASALWAQEQVTIRRHLERLVRLDFSGDSPLDRHFGAERTVYRVEAPFGTSGERVFRLDLGEGLALKVRGKIDRIDRFGDRAVIIDYKTGSSPIRHTEVSEGRNFQMMLYLLAAESLLRAEPGAPTEVEGGIFWHVGKPDQIEQLRFDEHGEALERGYAHLRRYIESARAGDFSVEPNKLDDGKCIHYCEFHHLCRVSTTRRARNR
jgi:ATP-dependent helicase/DNAse subunit B